MILTNYILISSGYFKISQFSSFFELTWRNVGGNHKPKRIEFQIVFEHLMQPLNVFVFKFITDL